MRCDKFVTRYIGSGSLQGGGSFSFYKGVKKGGIYPPFAVWFGL